MKSFLSIIHISLFAWLPSSLSRTCRMYAIIRQRWPEALGYVPLGSTPSPVLHKTPRGSKEPSFFYIFFPEYTTSPNSLASRLSISSAKIDSLPGAGRMTIRPCKLVIDGEDELRDELPRVNKRFIP